MPVFFPVSAIEKLLASKKRNWRYFLGCRGLSPAPPPVLPEWQKRIKDWFDKIWEGKNGRGIDLDVI